MIALDLCQPHYQRLLLTYVKFTRKNANHAKKDEKSSQNAIVLGLQTTNYITNVKNVIKDR